MPTGSKTPSICTSSFVVIEAMGELAGFFADKRIFRGHLFRKQEDLNLGVVTISGDFMIGENVLMPMGHFLITTGSALRFLSITV